MWRSRPRRRFRRRSEARRAAGNCQKGTAAQRRVPFSVGMPAAGRSLARVRLWPRPRCARAAGGKRAVSSVACRERYPLSGLTPDQGIARAYIGTGRAFLRWGNGAAMRFAAVRPRLNGRADGELRSCLQGCAFAGCALPLPRAALFSPRLQGGGARHSPFTKPAALSPAPAGADFFAPYRVAVVTYFPLRLQRRLQLLRSAILRRLLSPRLRRRLQRRPASGGADPFLLFHPARNGSPAQAFLAARFRGLLPGRAMSARAGSAGAGKKAGRWLTPPAALPRSMRGKRLSPPARRRRVFW